MTRTAFVILSQPKAEARTYSEREAVISLLPPSTPGFEPVRDARIHGAAEVLRIRTDDTEPLAPHEEVEREQAWGRPAALFTGEDADACIAFARKHAAAGRTIVVHCEAGISRSAAVACALDLVLHGNIECLESRHHPNAHIKATILRRAWGVPR